MQEQSNTFKSYQRALLLRLRVLATPHFSNGKNYSIGFVFQISSKDFIS